MPLNETKELAQIVDETILPMGTQRRGWLDDSARGYPAGNPGIQAAGVRRHYYRSALRFGRVEASREKPHHQSKVQQHGQRKRPARF